MKVKIGPFIHHYTTSGVENAWLSWRYGDRSFMMREKEYDRCDRIVISVLDLWQEVLHLTINKIQARRERNIAIHIDRYDTWSMDHTLSLIIVPMLKQLKETKHGGPWVDSEDAPEELRASVDEIQDYGVDGTTDKNWFERWDYVLDEMIYAFEMISTDGWEQEFYSGKSDLTWKPIDVNGTEVVEEDAIYFEIGHGPNDTFKVDREGMKVVQDRITNGTRLFGKYYQNLWD